MKSPEMMIVEEFLAALGDQYEISLGFSLDVTGTPNFFATVYHTLSLDPVSSGWAAQPMSAMCTAIKNFNQQARSAV